MSQLARTQDKYTAGIVCVPLTKPAILSFITRHDRLPQIIKIFETHKIGFTHDVKNDRYFVKSIDEIQPFLMKQIRRNFKSLRPRFISNWRYPLWEIDTKEVEILYSVLRLYRNMKLPVYFHESMRGYHFISVMPIPKVAYQNMVKVLRDTNPDYPPISIRLKANKYENELEVWKSNSGVLMDKSHSDTIEIKKMIDNQDIDKIAQKYYVVEYELNKEPVN